MQTDSCCISLTNSIIWKIVCDITHTSNFPKYLIHSTGISAAFPLVSGAVVGTVTTSAKKWQLCSPSSEASNLVCVIAYSCTLFYFHFISAVGRISVTIRISNNRHLGLMMVRDLFRMTPLPSGRSSMY